LRVMRRGCFLQPGVPLPAALRTARPGRMNAADYSAPSRHPAALLGFNALHPFAGLLPSPGGESRFRARRARVPFDQPVPAPAVFAGRPARPRRCIFMPRPTSPNRGWVIRGFRALTPVEDPTDSISRSDRSCLGLCPLAGLRTRHTQAAGDTPRTAHTLGAQSTRGLVTAGDSPVPGPLITSPSALGFAAPFLRRCDRNLVRLHPLARNRFNLAPASPALQRLVRLTPRQSNRSEPRWTSSLSEVPHLPIEMIPGSARCTVDLNLFHQSP
jgi:hypothetical protein